VPLLPVAFCAQRARTQRARRSMAHMRGVLEEEDASKLQLGPGEHTA